ncbi:RagB/SusD family nutrient uptake outer membrane protein [Flavivirga jejuensis]|uniref:RagB/SusD family nutrient uptake outer membrane protein n=1 Tax=Flavivirga jejuensis TaxID=870487 RepID=A0ABT8WUW3_9FLAO|nr:RagB/SusD family nutrient uptake outer membrane protein [Flavivirga jejuensis]MDO5976982.1 RagB/SusD family nutrient uptake outer membrane protein [Flavivirga jejuensis]
MKKNILFKISFFMLVVTSLFIFSCQELEPDIEGTLTAGNFFQTEGDLDAAVTAQYNSLLSFATYVHGQIPYFGGDDLTTWGAGNKDNFRQYDQFYPDADNGNVKAQNWNPWWKMVLTTNTVLDYYQEVDASQEYLDQAAGQAHFLRGLAYFFLVRTYGEVPLLSSTEVSGEEEKASFEAIYAQIISDFTQAKGLLPATWGDEQGRPTKWAAQSYLAHVYLTSAGFPLKNTANYALAAAEAKNVIDNGPYALVANFADLWNDPTTQNNSESIFAINFCYSCGGWTFGNWKSVGSVSPEESGWQDFFTEVGFFNGFPEGPRKEATFTTEFPAAGGGVITWQNSLHKHPYFAKWRGTLKDDKFDYNGGGPDLNAYLMRYSELLLTYAEARVMSTSSTDTEALASLNKVKRRAAGKPVNVPDPSVDVTSATQAEIVQERAWELAGEYSRWFDMVRTEIIEEVAANKDALDLPVIGTINEANPWALIPSSEVELNPNLGN